MAEFARGLAEALAGPDGDGVRRRLLAKALATERTLQAVLAGMLADHLAKGNVRSIPSLNAALEVSSRRLERLAGAHRADVQGSTRPVVMVGHADQVRIEGGS